MSNFTLENYNNLMNLVQKNEAFSFKDYYLDDKVYRIFGYRLASWSDFKEPSAMNCRGIMFDITDKDAIKLASLPPEKFFNYEEGGVDHTVGKLGDKMVKMDGSLISTFLHNGDLYLKSKGSIASVHCEDVMRLINLSKNAQFKEELKQLAMDGYTVSLEYTAPHNRIVVSYPSEKLTVLNIRSHETGENFFATKLKKLLTSKGHFPEVLKNLVEYEDLRNKNISHEDFVNGVRDEVEGEGYVTEIVVSDSYSYLIKNKNLKYVTLHHVKESISNPRRLFEAVVNEATDDLRSLFAHDENVLNEIAAMENYVRPLYNNLIKTVEDYFEKNKHLDKKTYAMNALKEHPQLGGLMIHSYDIEQIKTGKVQPRLKKGKEYQIKENDYKDFSIKNRKSFYNIDDISREIEEDEVDTQAVKKVTKPM